MPQLGGSVFPSLQKMTADEQVSHMVNLHGGNIDRATTSPPFITIYTVESPCITSTPPASKPICSGERVVRQTHSWLVLDDVLTEQRDQPGSSR